jgi:hypothetical protein
VLNFNGSTISSYSDLSIAIYKINSDGDRASTVSILPNKIMVLLPNEWVEFRDN